MLRLASFLHASVAAFLVLTSPLSPVLAFSDKAVAPLKAGGHVILMRHAQTVPGTADPPGFTLADCRTQRNLSEAGQEDARRFGESIRRSGIAVDRVLSSPWCRCIDTAKLALPDRELEKDTSLSSFVNVRGSEERRKALEQMRATIAAWRGPGNLLMVSHQQTIAALAGESLSQGGMLILKPKPGGFDIVAQEQP